MTEKKNILPNVTCAKKNMRTATGCIAALAFSLLFSPFVNYAKDQGSIISGLILSAVTWALAIGASVYAWKAIKEVSDITCSDRTPAGRAYKEGGRLTSFGLNREAYIADIAFLIGLALGVLRWCGILKKPGIVRMLPYSLLLGGGLLHLLFSGKTYLYISQTERNKKRGTK